MQEDTAEKANCFYLAAGRLSFCPEVAISGHQSRKSEPHFQKSKPTSRLLTSPQLTSPHLTSPHLSSPQLTSPHLTSSHLISSHLISSHLISPLGIYYLLFLSHIFLDSFNSISPHIIFAHSQVSGRGWDGRRHYTPETRGASTTTPRRWPMP